MTVKKMKKMQKEEWGIKQQRAQMTNYGKVLLKSLTTINTCEAFSLF